MTSAQRRELELLEKRDCEAGLVDGRCLNVLVRNGWAETFRGPTYSNRVIVGITEAGRAALSRC
jgi:hypothetical protein